MKIGIQTWGSNGDVRPLLALADGLNQAGHQITLAVSSIDNANYAAICAQLGIAYRQVPEYIEFDMEDFARRSFKMHALQWLKALLDEAFFPNEPAVYQAAQTLAEENDVLIGHHFLYPLKLAAMQAGKPFISVTFCHAAIATPSQAPFGFPELGRHLNPWSWRLLESVFDWALRKPLTALWRQAGYTAPKHMLSEHLTSQQLNLVAADPVFCLGRDDWRAYHRCCGFLNLDEDARRWQWPETLSVFLDDGPPPAYMTFGSLQQAVPEWSMDLFIAAAQEAGCRAIIQTSSPRYPANSRAGGLYFIGKHPHQPVFARCAAVVHHGGAGTTHTATRCGCPSVVVPFMDEQMFWARQLEKLGTAAKPLPAKRVSSHALAQALSEILKSAKYRERAQLLSRQMRRTDGVANAVAMIERHRRTTA